ncbi:Carcinoembryonic antigen-related cell adhesion molecule 3, partial [Lemmus lemmus]
LLAFLWTCGPLSTSAQVTIESVPPIIAEGGSVLLLIHNLPENIRSLFWYKGMIVSNDLEVARHIITMNSSVLGPAHSGRETVCSNGSLLLNNVTWKDAGLYTLRTLSTDMKTELAHMQLQVNTSLFTCGHPPPSSQPTIELVPRSVAEGESVLLLVHNLPENLKGLYWYKGTIAVKTFEVARHIRAIDSTVHGPAYSGRELLFSNGSLLLNNVIWKDSGFYTIRTMSTDLKAEIAHVQLQVNSK